MTDGRATLDFLQRFLNECCREEQENEEAGQRLVVTTSTLEDWLYRGSHPILEAMSLQVYAMWVFRIEKTSGRTSASKRPRFIDVEYAAEYSLSASHMQRIATEFRVPLFQGFTMPATGMDSETAAMYKQILLRPTSVPICDQPEDLRVVAAFQRFCAPTTNTELDRSKAGANAFTRSWLTYARGQEEHAMEARRRFLDRYEWPSIWETQEVHDELHSMWLLDPGADEEDTHTAPGNPEPDQCPDRDKPRVTMEQYVALIGEDVAANLEGSCASLMQVVE